MLYSQSDTDNQTTMSLQFLCLSLCVLPVCGNSLSGDVGQTDTTQTLNTSVEENIAKYFTILEAKNQAKFEALENENSFLRSELASLKSDFAGNHGNAYRSDDEDGNDATTITNRPSHVLSDTRNFRVSTSNVQPQVAFQSVLDHDIGNLAADETIKFNRVDLNVGDAYNGDTGMFICSVPGLYVFHINIVSHPGKSVELHFLKNGSLFGIAYIGDDGGPMSESSSSTFVVQLAASDTVWIVTDINHSGGEVFLSGYCYLSGYLLSPNIVQIS